MKTIKDLKDHWTTVKMCGEVFGVTDDFREEWRRRFADIGESLCNELSLSEEEVLKLPDDTLLSPRATQLLGELDVWYQLQRQQSESS